MRARKILLKIFPFFQKYEDNYNFMRVELNKIGRLFESRPYEELQKRAEELSSEQIINGRKLFFSAEAYRIKENGDLCFCIDCDGLPTAFLPGPSYHFYKRKDGSVYY